MHDLKRHLSVVHGVSMADIKTWYPDLSADAVKVRNNTLSRQMFKPVSAKELTNAFSHGLAVRNGTVGSELQPCNTPPPRQTLCPLLAGDAGVRGKG